MAEEMDNTIELLQHVWTQLMEPADEDWTTGSLDEMTALLAQLSEIQAFLGSVTQSLMQEMAAKMEADEVITGAGTITRRPRYSSTWIDETSKDRMHEDVLRALVQRVAVDPGTGEVVMPIQRAIQETWRLVTEAFSLGADPKASFRKVLGLRPDEYRAKRMTGYTVTPPEMRY